MLTDCTFSLLLNLISEHTPTGIFVSESIPKCVCIVFGLVVSKQKKFIYYTSISKSNSECYKTPKNKKTLKLLY